MLPRISGKVVLQLLQREGYLLLRVRGSHHYLRKPGSNSLVLEGTLRSIIRQAGMTVEQFTAALGRTNS